VPGSAPPLPPPTAFDRKYDPPPVNLSKVQPEPAPPPADSSIPVVIRPQPDVPPAAAGPTSSPERPAAAPGQPKAEAYDVRKHVVRQGETYAAISRLFFTTDAYAQALALYNKDRDPRTAVLQPGMAVYVPPAKYLEREFRMVIPGLQPPAARDRFAPADPGRVPPAPPAPGSPVSRAGFSAPPADPKEAVRDAGKDAPARSTDEKRYRVRANDTLWSVAKETLGNGERWAEIYRLNRELLKDVTQLQPGLVLRLPADAKVDAADGRP
jgi:nucleoid-associated protein YgaU